MAIGYVVSGWQWTEFPGDQYDLNDPSGNSPNTIKQPVLQILPASDCGDCQYTVKAGSFSIGGLAPTVGDVNNPEDTLYFQVSGSNYISGATMENTCPDCVTNGTLGNTISVKLTLFPNAEMPVNDLSLTIDIDGEADTWTPPVPTSQRFHWILTNRIWPSSYTHVSGAEPPPVNQYSILPPSGSISITFENFENPSMQDAYPNPESFLGSGQIQWHESQFSRWDDNEGASGGIFGQQPLIFDEKTRVRVVRQNFGGPIGVNNSPYEDQDDWKTKKILRNLYNIGESPTWSTGNLYWSNNESGGVQSVNINNGDNVVQKLTTSQDPNGGVLFRKTKEFTPTNYEITSGEGYYKNTTGQPESLQARFIIHGISGYECLVENFGVTMHGFEALYGTQGRKYVYRNHADGASSAYVDGLNSSQPLYSYTVSNGTNFSNTELVAVGTRPWLLEYAVNGYLDGSLGGGDGEALVGTWLDQYQYWSPAVWFSPVSGSTALDEIMAENEGTGGVNYYENWHQLPQASADFPNSGTFFCTEYMGRQDRLSSFLDMSGNVVEPYHPIGASTNAAELDSTGNQFPSYGQDGSLTATLSSAPNVSDWLDANYSRESTDTSSSFDYNKNPVKYILIKQCHKGGDVFNDQVDDPDQFATLGLTAAYEDRAISEKFVEIAIVFRDDWVWDSNFYTNPSADLTDQQMVVFLTNVFGQATPIPEPEQMSMPFRVELIDSLLDNNSGTITITNERGATISPTTKRSGFKNQENIYSISGSSIKDKPKKIATITIEAGSGKYFPKVSNLTHGVFNNDNIKMIPQRSEGNIVTTSGKITKQIFDIIYTNNNKIKKKFRKSVKNKSKKIKAYLHFKDKSLITRTSTIKNILFGSETLADRGEIRDISLYGSPNTPFVLTFNDSNSDSILASSNSTTINWKGKEIKAIRAIINKNGFYKFKQRFPKMPLIKRTAVNGSMAVSGATRIIFDDLTGVEVGDRLISPSINTTETITVTTLNPTGGNANECDVSSSITAADNTLVRFRRPMQYDLHVTPSSSLSSNIPTTDPTYTISQYINPTLTLTASNYSLGAGGRYTILDQNSITTGAYVASTASYVGRPNKTSAQLENIDSVKKIIKVSYLLDYEAVENFAYVKTVSPYTPTFSNVNQEESDWSNSVSADNGGTELELINTTITAAGSGTITVTATFDVIKWGNTSVTMNLDLDKIVKIA